LLCASAFWCRFPISLAYDSTNFLFHPILVLQASLLTLLLQFGTPTHHPSSPTVGSTLAYHLQPHLSRLLPHRNDGLSTKCWRSGTSHRQNHTRLRRLLVSAFLQNGDSSWFGKQAMVNLQLFLPLQLFFEGSL
jgi:hypothetical protein